MLQMLEKTVAHNGLVASFALVGVMATSAFAILLPSNLQVLMELKKPQPNFGLYARAVSYTETI